MGVPPTLIVVPVPPHMLIYPLILQYTIYKTTLIQVSCYLIFSLLLIGHNFPFLFKTPFSRDSPSSTHISHPPTVTFHLPHETCTKTLSLAIYIPGLHSLFRTDLVYTSTPTKHPTYFSALYHPTLGTLYSSEYLPEQTTWFLKPEIRLSKSLGLKFVPEYKREFFIHRLTKYPFLTTSNSDLVLSRSFNTTMTSSPYCCRTCFCHRPPSPTPYLSSSNWTLWILPL